MRWTKEQIKEALEKHLKWLGCEVGGKRLECHDDGLAGAYLAGANLARANLSEKIRIKFYPLCCPESGDFIGWKKAEGKIVKLKITGKRSSAYGRKCRCSAAEVLAIENLNGTNADVQKVSSDFEKDFVYEVGKTVSVDNFDEDRWEECSFGIHFFITRQEAVEYN